MRILRNIILMTFILFLGFTVNVFATEIYSGANVENYSTGGGGNSCSDKNGKYNGTDGIRITVISSNGNKLNSADFYDSTNIYGNVPTKSVGNNCSKIEYMKGTCSKRSNSLNAVNIPNFLDGNGDNASLINYLEKSSYSNLKSLIKTTGYNCIDNVGKSGCSVSTMRDTYIVVEPMIMLKKEFATAYEMGAYGINCWFRAKWASMAGFKSKDGTYFGASLKNYIGEYSGDASYYNSVKDLRSTNGIVIYSLSDIVDIPYGTITINKYDKDDNKLINSVKSSVPAQFTIYKGSGCTSSPAVVTATGGSVTKSLNSGSYSVKETKAPKGYMLDSTKDCIDFTIADGDTKTLNFYNEKDCNNALTTLKKTSYGYGDLVNLYRKYKVRGLLDLDNPSCTASTPKTDYKYENGCMYANMTINNFKNKNLSGFESEYLGTTYSAFCGHTFEFTNVKGIKNSYNFGEFKSGRKYLDLGNNANIGSGALVEKCYVFGSVDEFKKIVKDKSYSNYIGDISLDNKKLKLESISPNVEDISDQSSYKVLTWTKVAKYDFSSPIYLINGSGKISATNCSYCKNLGYGLISNLNNDKKEYKVPFVINDSSNKAIIDDKNSCSYKVENEIIKDKLQLEFRSIKVENPFPGKNGEGRNPKSNWNIPNRDEILKDRPNSYGIVPSTGAKATAKYIIELTPSTIKKIREDSKNINYDDYSNMQCNNNGTNCISKYLTELLKKEILKINNSTKRNPHNLLEIKPE